MEKAAQEKTDLIERITERIREYGSFNTGEVYADCSPCVNSMAGNVCQLAEQFFVDHIVAVTYVNDRDEGSVDIPYSELSLETLKDIWGLAEQWNG